MEVSNSIKKRFVKDYGLSIDVYQEPYFTEQVNKLGADKDFERMKGLIRTLGSEDAFFLEADALIEKVQNHIKNTEAYKILQKKDMKIEGETIQAVKKKYKTTRNLYKEENLNKKFVSIDLSEANFNMFRMFNVIPKEIKKYKDFLSQFTDRRYFLDSKHIRQIIFGGLMPNKQTIQQEMVIATILDNLPKELISENIVFNKDELVLEFKDGYTAMDYFNKVRNIYLDSCFTVEIFTLEELRDKKENLYFVKRFNKNEFELKAVPKVYYNQAYKKVSGEEITQDDLMFFYEGYIAYFKESVF